MKKAYFLFKVLTAALVVFQVHGQIPKAPVSVQSPNAAGLGQYGDVPVSLFTGLPQIDIPFYSIKEGNIHIPLSLSYQATGVRPDVHPGWVGLNWSLNAGGVITRVVKDLPDDDNELIDGKGAGFYFSHYGLNINTWSDKEYIRNDILASFNYRYDTEPDEFSFNFLGYSGKFYLDHARNWKVYTDQKIKISLIPSASDPTKSEALEPPFLPPGCSGSPWSTYGYIRSFSGFIITTEEGTQYVFGGMKDAIEYSISFFSQNKDSWIANAWYLTEIIDTNGHEITFTYERGPFVNQMYASIQSRTKKTTVASSYGEPHC